MGRWAAAGLVLAALVAGTLFFLLGIPMLVLWALSKANISNAEHFVAGLLGVPAVMLAFAPLLIWLNALYVRLVGGAGEDQPRGRRRMQGPLEYLLVGAVILTVVALFVWFFFVARDPPPLT